MSHTPAALLVFPYIETVVRWLALSIAPLLGLLLLIDRFWPVPGAEAAPLPLAPDREPD